MYLQITMTHGNLGSQIIKVKEVFTNKLGDIVVRGEDKNSKRTLLAIGFLDFTEELVRSNPQYIAEWRVYTPQ